MDLYARIFTDLPDRWWAGITYDIHGETFSGEGNRMILHSRTSANVTKYQHANIIAGFEFVQVEFT